jgi:hypothetical protein
MRFFHWPQFPLTLNVAWAVESWARAGEGIRKSESETANSIAINEKARDFIGVLD